VAKAQRGREKMSGWGKKMEVGRGWAENRSWVQSDEKILFRIKFDFLNIPSLWKFVGGDLRGILTWGFLLNPSRPLKYFRKMKYAMPCYAPVGKIN
jgi:hypothetical protein